VDNPTEYARIEQFLKKFMPKYREIIQLYDEDEPIFERFGVELEISRALERKYG